MSSPVIFSMTASQRDYLAAILINPATWPNFPRATRQNAVERGYTTRRDRPVLTPTGHAVAGLAHVLVGLAHKSGAGERPAADVQAGASHPSLSESAVTSV